MTNTLSITGMQFHAFHGCNPDERVCGTKYTVDVDIHADIQKSMTTDDLTDTIDYIDIHAITHKEMQIRSNLIEHVGKRILDKIVARFPQMSSVVLNSQNTIHPSLGRSTKYPSPSNITNNIFTTII